ncbi:MAG: hypothetical protein WKF84_22020 [Pyrinomonadaceae bacterium]
MDNVPVYVRKFFNDQEKIDGYIGLSLLSKFVSVVDYGARSLTLARSSNDLEPTVAQQQGSGVRRGASSGPCSKRHRSACAHDLKWFSE